MIKESFGKNTSERNISIISHFLLIKKNELINFIKNKKNMFEDIFIPRLLAYFINFVKNNKINKILSIQSWIKLEKSLFKILAKNII